MIRPHEIPPRGRVALVAPAGPLTADAIDRAIHTALTLGWEPRLGSHAQGRHGYLSGTDDERVADFNFALRAAENDAIWCLRGGYGTLRILDRLDWAAFAARPRPVIGFSDNTAIHLAIQRLGIVSFHGPHPATELTPFTYEHLRRALGAPGPAGRLSFPPDGPQRAETLVPGIVEGPLVGGNLSLLAATVGTPYAPRTDGAILFLEEVGEPSYRVDRLLTQLRLAGTLGGVAGIAIGALTGNPDDESGEIPSSNEVLRDRLGDLDVPIALGFPFGHVPDSWTLPLGVHARLDADAGTLDLIEPAVVRALDLES